MKVVIAGASGFIGRRLIEALLQEESVKGIIALSRTPKKSESSESKVTWRVADLADLETTISALSGATHAVYLVHSMAPQARLSQGSFDDFDLHQADNFARACRAAGIEQVFYLGGLLPITDKKENSLSDHLRSRLEVEHVLSSQGARVTALRAGLIIGPGGSSTEIMMRLVQRLPVMLAPRWAWTVSEPVAEEDVIRSLVAVILQPELQGRAWDITAGENLTYVELMKMTADALGLHRKMIPVPVFTPTLSRLWVSCITGAPRELIYPLLKSLNCPMRSQKEKNLLAMLGKVPTPIAQALRSTVEAEKKLPVRTSFASRPSFTGVSTVRSIQRFSPISESELTRIGSVAESYFNWLPSFLLGIVSVHKKTQENIQSISFQLPIVNVSLLELRFEEHANSSIHERFRITGGWLSKANTGGYLEFRKIPGEKSVLAIVRDFVPKLPWFLYVMFQASAHHWVMRRFGKFLLRRAAKYSV